MKTPKNPVLAHELDRALSLTLVLLPCFDRFITVLRVCLLCAHIHRKKTTGLYKPNTFSFIFTWVIRRECIYTVFPLGIQDGSVWINFIKLYSSGCLYICHYIISWTGSTKSKTIQHNVPRECRFLRSFVHVSQVCFNHVRNVFNEF